MNTWKSGIPGGTYSVVLAIVLVTLSIFAMAQSRPPPDPDELGNLSLSYVRVMTSERTLSPDDHSYWIIVRAGRTRSGIAPAKLPLVIFLHGYALRRPMVPNPSRWPPSCRGNCAAIRKWARDRIAGSRQKTYLSSLGPNESAERGSPVFCAA